MISCELCQRKFENKKGLTSHLVYCKNTIHLKKDVIDMYNNDSTILEICEKFKLSKTKVSEYIGNNMRSFSEAATLAHKKYPENFKHSEESKIKMRNSHIKWMKDNPEKTAWRLSNLSYPESLMLNKFLELGWDKKYLIVREKSFFPFFIDFAFENEKLALEIDGSQHLIEERKKSDEEKDSLLIQNGWKVIRVTEREVKKNINNVIGVLNDYLNDSKKIEKRINIGVFEYQGRTYTKKSRDSSGFTEKQKEGMLKQRKVERPPYNVLVEEVNDNGYEKTGKKYGVSGTAIKKWIKTYDKIGF